jgi:hypothetical protein
MILLIRCLFLLSSLEASKSSERRQKNREKKINEEREFEKDDFVLVEASTIPKENQMTAAQYVQSIGDSVMKAIRERRAYLEFEIGTVVHLRNHQSYGSADILAAMDRKKK